MESCIIMTRLIVLRNLKGDEVVPGLSILALLF